MSTGFGYSEALAQEQYIWEMFGCNGVVPEEFREELRRGFVHWINNSMGAYLKSLGLTSTSQLDATAWIKDLPTEGSTGP
jgi:hypothetical protein